MHVFWLSPVYCSQDLQVWKNVNLTLKLGLTALFTRLKIILLQCFQFSVFSFQFSAINDIQTDLNYQFFFSFYFVEKMLIVICGLLGCQKNMDNKCWFILYSISFSKKNVFFFSCLPTFWSNSLLRFYLKF